MMNNRAASYAPEAVLWAAGNLFGWLADLPWVPVCTLVLIPLGRFVAEQLSNRRELKRLAAEHGREIGGLKNETVGLKAEIVGLKAEVNRLHAKTRADVSGDVRRMLTPDPDREPRPGPRGDVL